MCSVTAMPADYDLSVAHTPPVFSHSPPSFYSSPLSCRRSAPSSPKPLRRANTVPKPNTHVCSLAPVSTCEPRRPILVLRSQETAKTKKRVVFADTKGHSLTQVRLMAEPSYMPPSWTSQFLNLVTQGVTAEVAPAPWECTFSQPASDYLEFRRRLDENHVSLENVIVKESEESIVGTVKVKNITFEKEVIVRSTSDGWSSQEDTYCTFVNNNNAAIPGSVKVIYDTFSFKVTLPPRSRRIEFCVCYRCGNEEFWDSNGGKNYVVVKKSSGPSKSEPMPIPSRSGRTGDVAFAKMGAWTEFASWNHLSLDGPYW